MIVVLHDVDVRGSQGSILFKSLWLTAWGVARRVSFDHLEFLTQLLSSIPHWKSSAQRAMLPWLSLLPMTLRGDVGILCHGSPLSSIRSRPDRAVGSRSPAQTVLRRPWATNRRRFSLSTANLQEIVLFKF
jgi:hypothetical protein